MRFRAALSGLLPPDSHGLRLATPFVLSIIGIGIAWQIATLPTSLSVALMVAGFAATIWLLFPESAVYALILLCPFTMSYEIGQLKGVRIQDPILVVLAVSVALSMLAGSVRVNPLKSPLAKIVFGLWLFLVVWASIAFLAGPANQWFLGGFMKNNWYLFRGVWRDLLLLPLIVYCINDRKATRRVINLIIIISVAIAIYTLFLAPGTGIDTTGPFKHRNLLAGYLILAIPWPLARLFLENNWQRKLLYAGILLLLLRTLMLAGSRGGYASFLASLLPFALFVPRRRLVSIGLSALVGLSLLLALIGNPLERPYVQRFLTLTKPQEQRTLHWRVDQWKLVAQRVSERPMLGSGSDWDASLLERERLATPHNGYLGVAVTSGIPAAAAWILLLGVLAFTAFRRCLILTSLDIEDRALWVGLLGFLLALMVHNTVDSTLYAAGVQPLFWIVVSVALIAASYSHKEVQARGSAARGA
jgi:O-antigen ligase